MKKNSIFITCMEVLEHVDDVSTVLQGIKKIKEEWLVCWVYN